MDTSEKKQTDKQVCLDAIQYILFDLDGTLYPSTAGIELQIKPSIRKQAARLLGTDENTVRRHLAFCLQERHVVVGLQKYHGIDPIDFLEAVFSDIDISTATPYSGLMEALRQLADKRPLGLVTNSSKGHARRMLRQFCLDNVFNHIFSVEDWDFTLKPDSKVYEGLLQKLKLPAPSILAFDDSYLNLDTAHQKGMKTVLVSNHFIAPPFFWEMHGREIHEAPDFVDIATHDVTDVILTLLENK